MLKLPDVVKAVDNQGLVVVTQTPAEFDKLIASEAARYGKILREAGVGSAQIDSGCTPSEVSVLAFPYGCLRGPRT